MAQRRAAFPRRLLLVVLLVSGPFAGSARTAEAAADPPYPRIGLYGHVDGRGLPIVKANGQLDPVVLDQVARHQTIVLDASPFTEYRPDALAALRARRADVTLLGYVQAEYAYLAREADSTVNLPTRLRILVRNLGGFLYGKQGNEYHEANVNLAKRNAQGRFVVAEAMADFFVDNILARGVWDGLFFDRYCNSIAWSQTTADSVDFVRAGYPTFAAFDAAWLAATDTLANRLRRRAGPAPVFIGNCGQGTKYATFNGWMRENFPFQNGGSWMSNVFGDPGGYLVDQGRFRAPYIGWLTAWPTSVTTPYDGENRRRARVALATAALGEGYGTINPGNIDPATGYMAWWYDEYAVDRLTGAASPLLVHTGWLGRPKGPYSRMVWAQPGVEDACDQNPGFEQSVTTGWTFTTTNGATVGSQWSDAMVGLVSAKVHVPSATGGASAVRYRTLGDVFLIADVYSAVFWAKASTPRTIEAAAISTYDGHTFAAAAESIGTTWARHQVLLNGSFGFAQLELRFGGKAGDVWIDDVHFQRGAPFVYRRDFDAGAVLLNTGDQLLSVQLEKSFRRIAGPLEPLVNDGGSGSLVEVRAGDALFLLAPLEALVDAPDGAGGPPGAALAWAGVAPNPAPGGASTRLSLVSPAAADAAVDLHDVTGRLVRILHRGPLTAGTHVFAWDGRDGAGRAVAPGLYFARARAGSAVAVRKLVRRD